MKLYTIFYTSNNEHTGKDFRYQSSSAALTEQEAIESSKRSLTLHGFLRAEVFMVESEGVPVWDSKVPDDANVGAGI